MNIEQVNKVRMATPLAGVALLKKERVTFNISGSLTANAIVRQYIDIPAGVEYVTDAQFSLTGSMIERSMPWSFAPRRFYFINEAATPVPRIYLFKSNQPNRVEVGYFVGTPISGSQSLSGTYQVHVDVWVFVSHFL